MRPGRLSKRVRIERSVSTRNAYGEHVKTWQPLFTRYATVKPLRSSEGYQARRETGELQYQVILRYDSSTATIQASDRLIYEGKQLDIVGPPINNGEKNIAIELLCVEKS